MPPTTARLACLSAMLAVLAACAPEPVAEAPDPAYLEELAAWKAERDASLRRDDGWLTLVGLFWLDEGQNTFGSSPASDLVFPAGTASHLGEFQLETGVVTMVADPDSGIAVDGQPVSSLRLASDATGDPTVLELGTLQFFLIDRSGRLGIRVKDTASPLLASFTGMEYFPVDPAWRVDAAFETFDEPRTIRVPNVMGTAVEETVPGIARFTHRGRRYELTPVSAPGEPLFFVFGDATNGAETYGGGRFLYAQPARDGIVVLDFNRAYNPPCVFTPYATCPLPPLENKLELEIRAGEKNWAAAH